jgi:hypothetical protein
MHKKAQGLSLTTIIVAALALIVLVVLVMVFTGRIGTFREGVEQAGQAELTSYQITYSDCRPTKGNEETFLNLMGQAQSDADKETARNQLKSQISACKAYTDETTCTGSGCAWK